jgi:hypothetical protein
MSVVVLALALQLGAGPQEKPVPPQAQTSPEEQYELRRVGFDDFAAVDFHRGGVWEWTRAYRGKYKEPLAEAGFYRYVGRSDLAASFEQQASKKRSLFAVGLAAGAVGFAFGGYGIYKASSPKSAFDFGVAACTDVACSQAAQSRADKANADERSGSIPFLVGGFGVAAAGFALFAWAVTIEPNPVDAPGARRLADEYNTRLRAELGLEPMATGPGAGDPAPPSTPLPQTPDGWPTSLMVAPVVGPQIAGLQVVVGF